MLLVFSLRFCIFHSIFAFNNHSFLFLNDGGDKMAVTQGRAES